MIFLKLIPSLSDVQSYPAYPLSFWCAGLSASP